jgi:solute:Na+ symporter, SSS family
VHASRLISVGVAVVAGVSSLYLPSILTAYRLQMVLMAGLGLVSLLRWFWWRVNATTELAGDGAGASALRLLLVVGWSGPVTLGVALLTRPESDEKLVAFFERVRPPALLWGPIVGKATPGRTSITLRTFLDISVCLVFVFGGMFGLGRLLLGEPLLGGALTAVGAAALVYPYWTVLRRPRA